MKFAHGQTLISVQNLSVQYRQKRSLFSREKFAALEDVNLKLKAGESLGVIGRNGVGKTTLLRILAGIILPDGGAVRNFGATTAMLSLQAGFDGESTGRTNILLSALLLGYSESQIRARMTDIIEFSELGEFIEQPLKNYSAGMRARLGFSICFHMQPDILLIDEALGVGDFEFRKKSAAAMQEKIRSDQTVVLVSHDENVIESLCDRAVWIESGVSRMEGDSRDVVDAYTSFCNRCIQ